MPALYTRASADLLKVFQSLNFLRSTILWINSWCYYFTLKNHTGSLLSETDALQHALFSWDPYGNKRPEVEQRQLPVIAYKGSKKKVILSNSTRKKWDLERFPLKNLTRRANFFTTQQYKCKHLLHSLLKNLELTKILSIFATWKEKSGRATMCGTVAWLWKHRDDEQFDLLASLW